MVGKSRVQKPCPPPLVPTDPPCPSPRAEDFFHRWLAALSTLFPLFPSGLLLSSNCLQDWFLRTWVEEERDLPGVRARESAQPRPWELFFLRPHSGPT